MSTLKVDSITNNGSAVDLTNGAFQIGGNDVVQGYTESASEPSSPTKGDLWWDTANEVLYQYLNGEFKELGITVTVLSVADFTYDNVSFSVTSEDSNPFAIAFNADGTKMYILGYSAKIIYQYSLSTGFDLSTASYDSVSFSVSSQDAIPRGIAFNATGTKMYIVGSTNDSVYQYSLSTAFNVGTASYDSVSFSIVSQETNPYDLGFSTDGTKMFVVGATAKTVFQYSLSTAFDLSTASYNSVSLVVSEQEANPYGLVFNYDGTKMFVVGAVNDSVFQYSLSTAFDLSTASYDSVSFSVASQDSTPIGIALNTDDTKMYILGLTNDTVYQYSTGL